MTSINFIYSVDGGCSFHRALQPARFCYEELLEHDIELSVGNDINGQDWIVFHSLPATSAVLHELLRLKRRGIRLCWSLDDDLAAIPDWNPAKIGDDGMVVFDIMARAADAVIVSTEHLREVMYGKLPWTVPKLEAPVYVCPNLLDLSTFPDSPFDKGSFTELAVKWPIRFVWTGSPTHKGDVEVIEEALIRLIDKRGPSVVHVIFAGSLPPQNLMRKYLHLGCMSSPSVPFNQYRRFANSLDADVWLAPLADIPFNLSKSNLRIQEGWSLGSCVVASDVGEYNCIRRGEDGFCAGSDPDEWFNLLDRLVLDHQTRVQVAANGRRRAVVECDWRAPANRKPWIKALTEVARM